MLEPVFRPASLGRAPTSIDPRPARPRSPPLENPEPCLQRPNALRDTLAGPFSASVERSGFLEIQGRQALHPLPRPADGVVILEPLWERPAKDPKHTRAEQLEARTLHCARQGVVRLSESNTKYGGKRGITGANAAPVMAPSISESKRIRQGKKYPLVRLAHVAHRLHRARFCWAQGLAFVRLT